MASPGPPLNAALPSRRPQRSQTPTSSQPATTTSSTTRASNAQGRGSLSLRVLTVEKFRQERLIRSRLNPPPPPPSKAIPVPLYPGETMAQYNHKLDQWLAERHESLESLRDNPKRERQFRLAFAFLRDNRKPSAAGTKTPKRKSIDEEYEEFYRRSASQELKRLRRDTSTERDRSEPRGRSPAHPAEERKLNRDTSSLNREHCSTDKKIAPRSHSRSASRPRDSRDHPLSSFQMPPRSSHRRSTSPASQSSYQSSHSRSPTEILASRVLSMEDYLQEMKLPKNIRNQRGPGGRLAKIPVPLFTGETLDEYEQAFGRWLHQHQTSVLSLRSQPLKERVYRHQYAYQRGMAASSSYSTERSQSHARSTSPLKTKESSHEKHELSRNPYCDEIGERSPQRCQDSDTSSSTKSPQPVENCVSTADVDSISDHPSFTLTSKENDQDGRPGSACKFAAAMDISTQNSRPQANWHEDELMSPTTESEHTDTTIDTYPNLQVSVHEDELTSSANSPELTHQEPINSPPAISQESGIAADDFSLRISGRESDMPISSDELPSWAMHLIGRVQELETQVTQLQRMVDSGECCQNYSRCKSTGRAHTERPKYNERSPPIASSTAVELNVLDVDDFDQTKCATRRELDNQVKECDTTACHLPLDPDKSYVSAAGSKTQVTEKHQTTEDIRHDATITLSRAVDSRAKADLKKRRLTEAYDRLNNQITMNETAIDDALDYIKTIKDVDYAAAMEQHSQVMELVVSINKEKEKRASALADLILYGWKGREDALLSLLAEESSEAHASGGADHERLSTISSQIEDKDGALKSLEAHLKEQLQWVTGISSNVSESDRALRFKALRKLSKRLAKEQTTKEQLERERQEVMESFLQIDTELRKLIKGSLVKNVKNKC